MGALHGIVLGAVGGAIDSARPIAGAPLLVRQIEWLRAQGVSSVIVNRVVDASSSSSAVTAEVAATGAAVTWIPSAAPLDHAELARRAGVDGVVVVIPHARLGDADLGGAIALATETGDDVRVHAAGLDVDVVHLGRSATSRRVLESGGWMRDVADEATCQALNEAILLGQVHGVVVRGTQVRDGIWKARGAVVIDGAQLTPPCFLGRDSFVAEGAIVGPGAVLDERAVVERDGRVAHARVAAAVVVGQGIALSHALASDGKVHKHRGGEIDFDDPLLVGQRATPALAPRLGAAIAVAALSVPAALAGGRIARAVHALGRVVEGCGSWVGVSESDAEASVVFDVESQLVSDDASEEAREAARAFYRAKKSLGLDVKLVAGLIADRARAAGAP